MQVYGLTTVPIVIDGRSYMMVGLSHLGVGILGVDFQHIYKCALEGWTGKCYMENYQHVTWAKPESAVQSARLAENVDLPPRRAKFCSVTVNVGSRSESDLYFEPTGKLAWMSVGADSCVVHESEPAILLWNPSSMKCA